MTKYVEHFKQILVNFSYSESVQILACFILDYMFVSYRFVGVSYVFWTWVCWIYVITRTYSFNIS